MKIASLSVICLTMLTSQAMAVGDKEAEALLAKMRHVYSSIKTVSIQVATDQDNPQTVPTPSQSRPRRSGPGGHGGPFRQVNPLQNELKVTSSILYSAPFNVSVKCSVNGFTSLRAICDGKQIASIRKNGVVSKQNASFQNLDSLVPINLESMCFFDWRRQLSTDKGMNMATSTFRILKGVPWNGKKWTVLEETAKAQRVICMYYIDPTTNLIWRTTTTTIGQSKPTQDCKVLSIHLNPKIPAGSFVIPNSQFIRI